MLPNYLANIKSSGIYRFVFDKSEMPGQDAEILRLVVGYSEKGPFNTPVYVATEEDFKKIFGGTSKKMERYGMWFHRMALQALKGGPILAFNLKNFENAPEGTNEVEYTTFNPTESIFHVDEEDVETKLRMAIKDLYNTDRFWTLDPEHLEDYLQDQETEAEIAGKTFKKGYITLTTTDSKDTSVTVFMRGYEPKGYDVPFMEWYSSVLNGEELPSYLEGHERDFVSQYFAEMFIFKGEFTPEIAASDNLAKFFNVEGTKVTLKPYIVNAFGEKVDTLNALAANDASNFLRKYTGILLPDFRNANNTVISLDAQVNADNYVHKLMMRLNQDMLYSIDIEDEESFQISDIDTTGWTKGPDFTGAMMSLEQTEPIVYTATFDAEYVNPKDATDKGIWNYEASEGHEGEPADYYKYEGLNPEVDGFTMKFRDHDSRFGRTGIREGDVLYFDQIAHVVKIKADAKDVFMTEDDPDVEYENREDAEAVVEANINDHVKPNGSDSKIGFTSFGDNQGTTQYSTGEVKIIDEDMVAGKTFVQVLSNDPDTDPSWVGRRFYVNCIAESLDPDAYYELFLENETSANVWVKLGATGNLRYAVDGQGNYTTRDEAKAAAKENLVQEVTYTAYDVQVDIENPNVTNIYKCVGSITATSANVRPLYLKGYTYGMPKPATTKQRDKLNWQTYMLNALKEYRGLRIALTSRVDLEYRYLVDTFEGFVQTECKSMLSTLCKEKDNAFAILNFPHMKNFSKCDYTIFRNEKNEFDTKYIPMGGNPLKRMDIPFSLPSQENGASWCGFFTSVRIQDPNTRVKEDVPSAALVSNNFMKKYTSYFPYTIIAGTNRGVLKEVGLLGPDFNFCREDLDNLEPFGVNCMVYVDRKGTCINSNQTAKQNPVTTLSKISTRELVIFLQDEIEKMMLDYHWDFNTPNLQQRIEDRANVILETAKNNGGVYVYRNQCDKYNNTDDVINNEMLVLSTSIEPGMGAGKMVQELYIYRKGGMSSMLVSDTGA